MGEVVYSISCTTRAPRAGEVHGRDYFFLTETEFKEHIERGDFFEHARVHNNYYGTLKTYVKANLERGVDVVMDIDVQGAAQVRSCDDDLVERCLVDIFILPPSVEALQDRLSQRGTEDQEKLNLRLTNAITPHTFRENFPALRQAVEAFDEPELEGTPFFVPRG
jgi:guanylate kinase